MSWRRVDWRRSGSGRWLYEAVLGRCDVDRWTAMVALLSGGEGGGVSRPTGAGAYEGLRWSLLGERGMGERIPWFMRKGEGGVSPRSRLEKRRNSDFFLDSAWGDSAAIMVMVVFCYPTMRMGIPIPELAAGFDRPSRTKLWGCEKNNGRRGNERGRTAQRRAATSISGSSKAIPAGSAVFRRPLSPSREAEAGFI